MTGKVLTFHLCEQLFGVDITLIKEINRNIEYTKVPGAKPHMAGLLNMRGQIVSLVDLAQIMILGNEPNILQTYCIVLKNSPQCSDYVGFLIDKPGSVIKVNTESCEPLPANIETARGNYLKELVKNDEGLIMIIDTEKIANIDNYK